MKFGVILHDTTMNMGDDIQTYAAMKHLPQVDYVVKREHVNEFRSENDEPVAVIMSAWWLWHKWNWPPAKCIIPMLTSMHINNYDIFRRSTPITNEWLEGVGGDFLKAYGPVGVRDMVSMDFFKERGFDSYFSGCITLTLPKQKTTPDAGTYVCLVDLNDKLKAAARKQLKNTGLEIREVTHHCDYRNSDATFEERMKAAEELLTIYQNAKFVITRRLHVTLPCMAMEVPVLSVVDMEDVGNTTRWNPYQDWGYYVSEEDFAKGKFDFDFKNPPKNKKNYLATREKLTAEIADFVKEMENCNLPLEQVRKTNYTEEEVYKWRYELMDKTLELWLHQNRKLLGQRNKAMDKLEYFQKMDGIFIRGVRKIKRIILNIFSR